MGSTVRRTLVLAVCASLVLGTLTDQAAGSAFSQARLRRVHLAHRIDRLRHGLREREGDLRVRIRTIDAILASGVARRTDRPDFRWRKTRHSLLKARRKAVVALRGIGRHARHEVTVLSRQRTQVVAWIERWGVLHTCPVRGPHVVNNDFGIIVRKPGVPVHVHEGNDISASMWTPVVAPFSGRAVAVPNGLGGLAVDVYGTDGYAYNAHFVAYGHLGEVSAGTVIGYVGATGDAGGPHLHFEWHPNDGAAVDPYPYLTAVC